MSKQTPSIRLSKRVQAVLDVHMARMEKERGVVKSASQFCAAALVDLFRLSSEEQLQRIYRVEEQIDALRLSLDADAACGHAEPPHGKGPPGSGRKGRGNQ